MKLISSDRPIRMETYPMIDMKTTAALASAVVIAACGGSTSGSTTQTVAGGGSSNSGGTIGTAQGGAIQAGTGGSVPAVTSGGTSETSATSAGGSLSVSRGTSAGGSSSVGGGTLAGGSSTVGGGTSAGGTSATASTTVPLAIVANGASCSPVAARACSTESNAAQMVCSAGNVWQWSADCAFGTFCDPRPGLKVGQCAKPDTICASGARQFCDTAAGTLYTCIAPGFIADSEQCRTSTCQSSNACATWVPCDPQWTRMPDQHDCSGECPTALPSECKAPIDAGSNGLWLSGSQIGRYISVVIPPSASLPGIAECPDIKIFWLWFESFKPMGYPILLPKGFKAVIAPLASVKSGAAAVAKGVCSLPATYATPTVFNPGGGDALMLITTENSVPSFRFILM